MAKRSVVWTRTADIQFVGILEYWLKRNKSNTYSKKLFKLVAEKFNHDLTLQFGVLATDCEDEDEYFRKA